MIQRLINFYNASSPPAHSSGMSIIWQGITYVRHKELKDALNAGHVPQVQKVLDEFVMSGGSQGVDPGPPIYFTPDGSLDRSTLSNEDLGIPDPKTGKIAGDPEKPLGGAAQVCLRIAQLCGGVPGHVLEIGSGLDFDGVIFNRWGAKSYTTIDLPTMALAGAFFMSRVVGKDNVRFYGEPWDESKYGNIYPSTDCREVVKRKYDVILNVNSFPEMPNQSQNDYLRVISECLSPTGFFLSINHENTVLNQRSVASAIQEQDKLVCASRIMTETAYTGYVEEMYVLKKA